MLQKDTIQNIFIGLLIGGLILLSGGVYFLYQQMQQVSQTVSQVEQAQTVPTTPAKTETPPKVSADSPEGKCVNAGGTFTNGICSLPDTDAASISYGDFVLHLPLDLEFRTGGEGVWKIFAYPEKEVGELRCPPPEVGYEAWSFADVGRSYVRDGKTLYATKAIGTPSEEDMALGSIALISGGVSDEAEYNPRACLITLHLDAQPTDEQLGWVDALYGLIF